MFKFEKVKVKSRSKNSYYEVGIFSPFPGGDLGCSVTTEWIRIACTIVPLEPFSVVLHNFARNWGLPIAQK